MKDRKRHFLKDAVVLMIVSAMVLSAIPAVTADDKNFSFGQNKIVAEFPSGWNNVYDTCKPLPRQTPDMSGGVGADAWISYCDDTVENSIGLTAGGECAWAIELSDIELAAYRTYDVVEIEFSSGSDTSPYACSYEIWVEDSLPADPLNDPINIVATGTSSGATNWNLIDVIDTAIPDTGSVWVGINVVHTSGQYPMGLDESNTVPPRGGLVYLAPSWDNIQNYFPGVWAIKVGVSAGGPGPVGDCLPDQCDFELVSINNIMPGPINSLPQIINITIRNNGEVGISELKLLADVYEKVCGPTTTICCDNVYDLCDWEAQAAADWSWYDDGDGDSFVLQGGPDNRWLTNDQAWRNTMGEDRSFGGDEDVYLGLSPGASGFDMLEWHCADSNDISGAACATFTFSHWMEGEYFFDADGNLNPIDYGTLAYSLDGGMSWTELDMADFVAYDTEGEWEDVTIKFINTAIYEDAGYYEVCDDCEPGENDIVIDGPFPDVANLHVRWIWHKDPCLQFEGWYIDNVCLDRTEMYELILVHQTHDIIELPPCDPEEGPQNIYYEFPLGFDPEPDTWYQICILGQVFDCPDCCELIFDNNEMCIQFFVTDIHDMACISNEIIDPQDWWRVGDTICVNTTVKNLGTFAENNVPVDLKVGQQILDRALDAPFETDQMGEFDYYYFTGSSPEVYFRWTQGDATIDGIGDGRSVLPGDESVICAEEGFLYPYLPNGAGCGMADPNTYDLSDVVSADLNFYAKWSIPPNEDCDGDGYIDSFWGVLIHPTSGPDSAYWWFAGGTAYFNYQNDWEYMSFDLKALAEGFEYDGTVPEIEWLIGAFMCTSSGNTVPAGNPIPWSGLMIDNIQFDIVSCGSLEVVDTQYTGSLAPGAEETIVLCWDDAEFSNWCFQKDVQLPGDIDPDNDICWDTGIKVRDSYPLTGFSSVDLTGGDDDCLWQICCTRACDGTCCAWAGVIEETSGHYIPDMDDNLVSPFIPMDVLAYPLGVSLQITTWYDFAPGDYGEVYMRNSSGGQWIKLRDTVDFKDKIIDNSGGVFKVMEFYIEPWMFSTQIQIRFRMKSNSDDMVAEGWYICNVDLIEVTAIGPPPAPGDTWYGFDAYSSGATNNQAIWFDSTTPGTLNAIGPNTLPNFWSGGTWADGEWYISVYGNTGLYKVDPGTAATSLVGPTSTYFNGLGYEEGSDKMYGCNGYNIYEIDRYSGTTTLIGSISQYLIDLTCGQGLIWGHDFVGEQIVTIIPGTTTVTVIGGTGLSANYAQGMEYDKGNDQLFLAAYTTSGALYEVDMGSGNAILIGGFQNGAEVDAFAIPYVMGDIPLAYGALLWNDDFDRVNIAPWQCIALTAGDHWDTQAQCISDYPLTEALNNAMYTKLDLTAPELYYAELYFTTEWEIEDGTTILIEISPDWDGAEPMQDATWVPYWMETGPSTQGLISAVDLVDDDRFIINEFIGEEVYLRFRITTAGEGTGTGGFWCIHDKTIIYKEG
jgi:hypothetical protein